MKSEERRGGSLYLLPAELRQSNRRTAESKEILGRLRLHPKFLCHPPLKGNSQSHATDSRVIGKPSEVHAHHLAESGLQILLCSHRKYSYEC